MDFISRNPQSPPSHMWDLSRSRNAGWLEFSKNICSMIPNVHLLINYFQNRFVRIATIPDFSFETLLLLLITAMLEKNKDFNIFIFVIIFSTTFDTQSSNSLFLI
jgi:hypothetical protein